MKTLEAIAQNVIKLHKEESDLIKRERIADEKAQKEFHELIKGICQKYQLKIDKENTMWDMDCDGSFTIAVIGVLDLNQVAEIKILTQTEHIKIEDDPRNFQSRYTFTFDFKEYWGEEFQ